MSKKEMNQWKSNCFLVGCSEGEILKHQALHKMPASKEPRRIVQIAAVPADKEFPADILYALCNDESIWVYDYSHCTWEKLTFPSIPQDDDIKTDI